jgi:hypothetical protein
MSAADIVTTECRLARRLGRLFRIERSGGFARRPQPVASRCISRRGALIEALMQTEVDRRAASAPISPELRDAAQALWDEVGRSRASADARLERLETELRTVSGLGPPSGLRGSTTGRLIGRG